MILRPHPGPQERFLSSPADVVWFGGAAGPGKTFCLLLASLRHIDHPKWHPVTFRRSYQQITMPGALIDESREMFSAAGGHLTKAPPKWTFESGAEHHFRALQYEDDVEQWKGAQLPWIGFDQIETFTEKQIVYLMSRNRTAGPFRPQVMGTINPPDREDPNCAWIYDWVDWYLDDEGDPIPDRSGVLRYFIRVDDELIWADDPADLEHLCPADVKPTSFTLITATLEDNPSADPDYKAKLLTLSRVDQRRLLDGNWYVTDKGTFFSHAVWDIIEPHQIPTGVKFTRYWDRAATEMTPSNPDPDATCGALTGFTEDGRFVVADVRWSQESPQRVEQLMIDTAHEDGVDVDIWIEQERGSAGIIMVENYARRVLRGYSVRGDVPTGQKDVRAKPWRALAEPKSGHGRGNVLLVRGSWVSRFLSETRRFPKRPRDAIDAVSGGYKVATQPGVGKASSGTASGRRAPRTRRRTQGW